jgi:IPT/TIG domain
VRAGRDGHHSEREPSARALAAMAEAAQRSRQSTAGSQSGGTVVEGRSSPRPADDPAGAPALSGGGGTTASAPRVRRLSRPLLVMSVGLVAAVTALVVSSSTTGRGTTSHSTSASVPQSSPATSPDAPAIRPPATSSTTIPPPASAPAVVPPPTTTVTPPPNSGGPVLSALQPSSGVAGQVLVVTGTNFLSPSGRISAHFGAQVALIACPQSTSCLVEVPPTDGTTAPVPVTVTTDGGTTNPLTFTYG